MVLVANLLFCARFGVFYALLMPAAAFIDYLVGLGLMRCNGAMVRRLLVSISLY